MDEIRSFERNNENIWKENASGAQDKDWRQTNQITESHGSSHNEVLFKIYYRICIHGECSIKKDLKHKTEAADYFEVSLYFMFLGTNLVEYCSKLWSYGQ